MKFVKVVLAETEDVWTRQFQLIGHQYRVPKLVLFTGHVNSACGFSSTQSDRFTARTTRRFISTLVSSKKCSAVFHSPGDFAQAYVIAHEVGHHVQKLLGKSDQVDALRRRIERKGIQRAFSSA